MLLHHSFYSFIDSLARNF